MATGPSAMQAWPGGAAPATTSSGRVAANAAAEAS